MCSCQAEMIECAATHPGRVSAGKRVADHVDCASRLARGRGSRSNDMPYSECRVVLAGIEVSHPCPDPAGIGLDMPVPGLPARSRMAAASRVS